MDDFTNATRHGLQWPERFEAIKPAIQEQWGVTDDLYLLHSLGGGRSGAAVYAVDVTCDGFSGQGILKLDDAADPIKAEEGEVARLNAARHTSPDFATEHLPRVVHSLHHSGQIAILSTVAGRGLEYANPWASCAHDFQTETARMVSRDLLEDWNRDYKVRKGLLTPSEILNAWLRHRIDPQQGASPQIHGRRPWHRPGRAHDNV